VRTDVGRRALALVGPVVVALALLGAIEIGLRLAGFEVRIPSRGDPYSNLIPFTRPDVRDGVPVVRVRQSGDTFLATKPPNGFRVFVLGESSVEGTPYGARWAFSAILERRLAAALPSRTVEVVNAGVTGIGSEHIRRIAEELAHYAPDLMILYAGHNDWILAEPPPPSPFLDAMTQLRLYHLAIWTTKRIRPEKPGTLQDALTDLFQPLRPAAVRAAGLETLSRADADRILARFLRNTASIVQIAHRAGATAMLATVGQDLHDWPPTASRHRDALSPTARAAWDAAVARGDAARTEGRCADALADYDRALRLDAHPASLHFARAACLEREGRLAEARRAYQRASDLDAVPMGTPSVLNHRLADVARENGAVFVDVERSLAAASFPFAMGADSFCDYVHPNLRGHALIARTLAQAIAKLPAVAPVWRPVAFHGEDPDAIKRAHPELGRAEAFHRVFLYRMLGMREPMLAEAAKTHARYPDLDLHLLLE
jgi:lysophospholipase L1-like esterase